MIKNFKTLPLRTLNTQMKGIFIFIIEVFLISVPICKENVYTLIENICMK